MQQQQQHQKRAGRRLWRLLRLLLWLPILGAGVLVWLASQTQTEKEHADGGGSGARLRLPKPRAWRQLRAPRAAAATVAQRPAIRLASPVRGASDADVHGVPINWLSEWRVAPHPSHRRVPCSVLPTCAVRLPAAAGRASERPGITTLSALRDARSGCTGIEIESVAITSLLQPHFPGLRLNACDDRCPEAAPATQRAIAALTTPRTGTAELPAVIVVHVAWAGICGVPPEVQQTLFAASNAHKPRPLLIARAARARPRHAQTVRCRR